MAWLNLQIGEAVREERNRLEMAFKVADRICQRLLSEKKISEAKSLATKTLHLIEKCPPYLERHFRENPLKSKFVEITEKK